MAQMYKWSSDYLKQYGKGTILVVAENIEGARKKVTESFEAYDKEHFEWNYVEDAFDEEDIVSIRERKNQLFRDISFEPVTEDVCFIKGSE